MRHQVAKMTLASLAAVLLVVGCTTTVRDLAGANGENSRQARLCESRPGGRLAAITNFRNVCTWPSNDAGKFCVDASGCDGICEVVSKDGSFPDHGTCSALQAEQKDWLGNCALQLIRGKPVSECVD